MDMQNTEDYFASKTIKDTHNGSPLTEFEMEVTKVIQNNPIFYAEHQDERGFMHLDQEDAEHCALKIGNILRKKLAELELEVTAKALLDAATFWSENPDEVDDETPADCRNWLRDLANDIKTRGTRPQVSTSSLAIDTSLTAIEKIERLREIHAPLYLPTGQTVCSSCLEDQGNDFGAHPYPCPTILILDGREQGDL